MTELRPFVGVEDEEHSNDDDLLHHLARIADRYAGPPVLWCSVQLENGAPSVLVWDSVGPALWTSKVHVHGLGRDQQTLEKEILVRFEEWAQDGFP